MKNFESRFFLVLASVLWAGIAIGQDIEIDLDGRDTPKIFERWQFWLGVAVVILLVALIRKRK